MERTICLTDAEAALAAKGQLRALVRKIKPQPQYIVSVKEALRAGMEKRSPVPDMLVWIDAGVGCRTPEEIAGYSIFGKPGTVLKLKETWRYTKDRTGVESYPPFEYKANYAGVRNTGKWRSPVTMPLFAIRHRFTVKKSRAMQIQNITYSQAVALGVDPLWFPCDCDRNECKKIDGKFLCDVYPPVDGETAIPAFAILWDDVHPKEQDKWKSNPWIWYATVEETK